MKRKHRRVCRLLASSPERYAAFLPQFVIWSKTIMPHRPTPSNLTRREFTHSGAALVSAASAAASFSAAMVHSSRAVAEETRELRLGIIGCGGRGTGAINDSLSINSGVKLVVAADLFPDKCAALWKRMREAHPDKVAATDTSHDGLDGYRRILDDKTIDVVHITTSPGFRPLYVREAVEAGKHVFTEKPACVDPAGYRICLEAHDAAVAKGTAIVAGTQYRRQVNYVGAIDQIRAGAIGDVVGATARYCGGGIWYRPRAEGMSDAAYQMNNWYHFVWLSGDHIVEQAVHNLDTMNWVMGANPVSPTPRAAASIGPTTANCGTASACSTSIPTSGSCRSCAVRFLGPPPT
jgi:predicted dehydrogenase